MRNLIKLKCTSCGANLLIEEKRDYLFCQYCGAKLILDNDNEHIYRYIDEADIKRAETEQIIKLKQLELEEKEKENKRKMLKTKIIFSLALGAIGIFLIILGNVLGKSTGDSDSSWYMLEMLGLFPLMGAFYMLLSIDDKK